MRDRWPFRLRNQALESEDPQILPGVYRNPGPSPFDQEGVVEIVRYLHDENPLSPAKATSNPSVSRVRVTFADSELPVPPGLLEPESSTALVEGPGFYAELPRKKKQVKALSDDPGYQEELKRHLAGAATYCDRLRGEAFHFFCKEKIKEVKGTIESNQQRAKGKYNSQFLTQLDIKKILKPQERTGKQFQTYIFDYQLISNNKQVKEQRKPLSGSKGEESIQKISGLISSFLTQKAAFGPLTLLARERQALLRFRLLRFDNFKGKRCAVIEAIPKKPRDIHFAYGLVWVDSRDFSIPRIELDPNSIQGYGQLLRLAKKLRARLFLQCTITYNNIRKGLRFPTQITIKETYQGSNSMYNALGTRNWERNKTQISYYDYRFFDVDATVVAER